MADITIEHVKADNTKVPVKYHDNGDGTYSPTAYGTSSALPTGGTPTDGTLAATTVAAALGSQACKEVVVQNDPDNTVDVFVGDATNQRFQLKPGQAIAMPVSNVSLVYAKTASSTGAVNWISIN